MKSRKLVGRWLLASCITRATVGNKTLFPEKTSENEEALSRNRNGNLGVKISRKRRVFLLDVNPRCVTKEAHRIWSPVLIGFLFSSPKSPSMILSLLFWMGKVAMSTADNYYQHIKLIEGDHRSGFLGLEVRGVHLDAHKSLS